MTDDIREDGCPDARVIWVSPDKVTCKINCPHCAKVHTHGFGDGHRIAHCADKRGNEYNIVGCDKIADENDQELFRRART